MYFVGIDVSKYKHDCFILNDLGEVVVSHLVIANSQTGFSVLLSNLKSLDDSHNIRIGFEATGHYTSNLKRFLENVHYSFMESSPALISKYIHSQTLRKTKNDSIDACRFDSVPSIWSNLPISLTISSLNSSLFSKIVSVRPLFFCWRNIILLIKWLA